MALGLHGLQFLRELRKLDTMFHKRFDATSNVEGNAGKGVLPPASDPDASEYDFALFDQCKAVFGDTGFTDTLMRTALMHDEAALDDCETLLEVTRSSVRNNGLAGWLLVMIKDAQNSIEDGHPSPFMFDSDFTSDDDAFGDDLSNEDSDVLFGDMLRYEKETHIIAARIMLQYGTDEAGCIEAARALLSDDGSEDGVTLLAQEMLTSVDAAGDEAKQFLTDATKDMEDFEIRRRRIGRNEQRAREERKSDPMFTRMPQGRVVLSDHIDIELPDGLDGIPDPSEKSEAFLEADRLFVYDAMKTVAALERLYDNSSDLPAPRDECESVWEDHDFVVRKLESLIGPQQANLICGSIDYENRRIFDNGLGDLQFAVDMVRQAGLPLWPAMLMSAAADTAESDMMKGAEGDALAHCRELGASMASVLLARIQNRQLAAQFAIASLDCDLNAYADLLSPWYGDDKRTA